MNRAGVPHIVKPAAETAIGGASHALGYSEPLRGGWGASRVHWPDIRGRELLLFSAGNPEAEPQISESVNHPSILFRSRHLRESCAFAASLDRRLFRPTPSRTGQLRN